MQIHDKVSRSIRDSGWFPKLFRRIVNKAKEFLQNLIREHEMLPKPTLSINMTEFRTMRNLMIRVQGEAKITLTPNTTPQGRTLALRDSIYP